jgi:hypothetical protein
MSLWIYKKRPDARGGRDIVLLPIAEMLLPAIILLVLLISLGISAGLLLMSLGFILFLAAKTSQLTKGIYISCGSKSMSSVFRTCYRLGYGLMFVGLLAVLFSLKMNR